MRTPKHVAIIMDGNGRWAKARGMPRSFGHRAGVEALRRTVEAAPQFGVECLTVYSFSTENWTRPEGEIRELFSLLRMFFAKDIDRLIRDGVRLKVIGFSDKLPPDILSLIEDAETRSAANTKFTLQVAFNYGAQADIARAARLMAEQAVAGTLKTESIDIETLTGRLSTAGAPALDLLIRTSGEQRLSNFLLWEAAYAEFVFQDVLWPDYGPGPFGEAIAEFSNRDRRYGGIGSDDLGVA